MGRGLGAGSESCCCPGVITRDGRRCVDVGSGQESREGNVRSPAGSLVGGRDGGRDSAAEPVTSVLFVLFCVILGAADVSCWIELGWDKLLMSLKDFLLFNPPQLSDSTTRRFLKICRGAFSRLCSPGNAPAPRPPSTDSSWRRFMSTRFRVYQRA